MLIDPAQLAAVPNSGQALDRAGRPTPPSPVASVSSSQPPATSPGPTIKDQKEQAEAIQHKVRETEVSVTWDKDQVMIYKVTDKITGDLISQIPTDQVLGVVHRIEEIIQQMSAPATQNGEAGAIANEVTK